MKLFPAIGILLMLPLAGAATSLRLEGDHAWLCASNAPLRRVLGLFGQRGVAVFVDPAVANRPVSGDWKNTPIDRLVGQLAGPDSYMVERERTPSPLGTLYKVSSIRIFSTGNAEAAQPLQRERVLDVVTGTNGVQYLRGEIMVGFDKDSTIDDLNALLRKVDGSVIEVIDPPGIYRIRIGEDLSVEEAMAIAGRQKGVEGAEPNRAFPRVGTQPAAYDGPAPGINLHLKPGETAVAVFDSGLDPQYADLPFIRGTYNALDPAAPMEDPLGHGTLTAMIAAGAVTPIGAEPSETGVPVLAIRTFDQNGYTSSDTLMRAIEFAAESGVDIVSMSWGSETPSGYIKQIMDYAAQKGIALYAAAGNEPTGVPIYPAGFQSVTAVGGLDPDGSTWNLSNYGDFVEDYEPAFARFEGKTMRGTSISAPYAAFKAARNSGK